MDAGTTMPKRLPCKRSDVEFIVWLDAVSEWTRGDMSSAADLQLATNVNVGWAIHENTDRIVFCNGTSSTGEMDHLVIPTASVLQRISIGKSRNQRKRGHASP